MSTINEQDEEAALTKLCERLGASGEQARTMARQLLKRAGQLSEERGISKVAALEHLLSLVVKARAGEPVPGFEGVDKTRGHTIFPVPAGVPTDAAKDTPFLDMKQTTQNAFQATFGRAAEVITRAPGRIEFIGNHTDYNGGTVFGASIDRGVTIAVSKRTDGMRRFFSSFAGEIIEVGSTTIERQAGKASWVNYPLGVLKALEAFGLKAPAGFDFLASSDLPPGAGLSSSAALELSSALAFLSVTGQTVDRETVVKIGKHAENHFVGVPCGILDQGVSGFGLQDHLVYIDCRGPKFDTVKLPGGVHFWIFNTHTKHALVDGLYAARHRECMDAAKVLGVDLLVNASLAQLDAAKGKLSVEAEKRARHIIEEIARVEGTRAALAAGDLAKVGSFLTASHRSSQHLFENSTEELDFLVDSLVNHPAVLGARLTGGGFGGAVMAFTGDAFDQAAAEGIADLYSKKYDGSRPDILHTRTGDGAKVL